MPFGLPIGRAKGCKSETTNKFGTKKMSSFLRKKLDIFFEKLPFVFKFSCKIKDNKKEETPSEFPLSY